MNPTLRLHTEGGCASLMASPLGGKGTVKNAVDLVKFVDVSRTRYWMSALHTYLPCKGWHPILGA